MYSVAGPTSCAPYKVIAGRVKWLTRLPGSTSYWWCRPPLTLGSVRAEEAAIMRTNLSSKSVPRFELDHRSREVRLRLERIDRLLVSRASVTHSWLRRLLCLFGVGMCGGDPQDGRARGC